MLVIENADDMGAVVRSRRESLGLSQKAVAEQAGISWEWISRFEGGRIPHPDLSVVLKVLKTLDIGLMLDPGRQHVHDEDFADFEEAFSGYAPPTGAPRP